MGWNGVQWVFVKLEVVEVGRLGVSGVEWGAVGVCKVGGSGSG